MERLCRDENSANTQTMVIETWKHIEKQNCQARQSPFPGFYRENNRRGKSCAFSHWLDSRALSELNTKNHKHINLQPKPFPAQILTRSKGRSMGWTKPSQVNLIKPTAQSQPNYTRREVNDQSFILTAYHRKGLILTGNITTNVMLQSPLFFFIRTTWNRINYELKSYQSPS